LAQIGSACVFRRDDRRIRTHARRQRIIFLAPKGPDGLSDDVWDAMEKALQGVSDFKLRDTSQHGREGGRRTDPRTHAGGIARRAMHKLEVEIIDSTDASDPPVAKTPGRYSTAGFASVNSSISLTFWPSPSPSTNRSGSSLAGSRVNGSTLHDC
jgi:hypothetical protein